MADIDFSDLGATPVESGALSGIDFSDLGAVDVAPTPAQPTKTESFIRGALRNFPLAQQATAAAVPTLNTITGATTSPLLKPGIDFLTQAIVPEAEKMVGSPQGLIPTGTYGENLNNLNAKADIAKKANPLSYDGGAIAGALAPVFAPGAGEALKAAPITGNALLGATNALTNTNLLENPKKAIAQGAIGATIGGGLGYLGNKIAPYLETQAANAAGSLTKFTPKETAGLLAKYAKTGFITPDEPGVVQMVTKSSDLKNIFGQDILDMLNRNGTPLKPIDSIEDVLSKAKDALGNFNDQHATLLNTLDKVDGGMNSDSLDNIKNQFIQEASTKYANQPLRRSELNLANKILSQMDQIDKGPAGEITYNGLQDFKNLLQTKISDFSKVGSNMPKEPLEDALRAVRTEMGSSVDKAVAGDPQLRKLLPEPYSFSDLLHQESRFYDIVDGITTAAQNIEGQGFIPSWRKTPVGLVAGLAAYLGGGGFLGAMAAGTTATLGYERFGPQAVAYTANKLAQPATTALINTAANRSKLPANIYNDLSNFLNSKYRNQLPQGQ